jgi:zinc transport system ATP-binding protein
MLNKCDHCCTKIEGLTVNLGAGLVLDNVGLHLNCREMVAIVGPNGAGKTTLLKAMLREVPYQGVINYLMKGQKTRKPRIGYVPQKINFDYDSPISVLDLIASALSRQPVWMGITGGLKRKAVKMLEQVEAGQLLNRRLGELSGGELQRVLLAVAMIPVPDLLLLDEPVAAIDVRGLAQFYQIVSQLKNNHDVSIIMVTHDLAGIAPHADRMILLNKKVITEGSPKDVLADRKMLEVFGPNWFMLGPETTEG